MGNSALPLWVFCGFIITSCTFYWNREISKELWIEEHSSQEYVVPLNEHGFGRALNGFFPTVYIIIIRAKYLNFQI